MCSALALAAAYALAAPAFDWNAPTECPSAQDVRADVERHLGASLDEVALATWSVKAEVSGDAGRGWTLALVIETPDGRNERTLQDPHDCAAVSSAAALLIALALDPEAVDAAKAEPKAVEEPEVERDDAIEPVQPPPPRPPPPVPFPLYFVVGAAGGLDFGTLRSVSPIGKATIAWQLPRVRVGVNATFGASPGFRIPAVSRDISLWLWTVGAEAGPVLRRGKFEFPLLAGIEAGQISIRPRVLLDPTRRQVVWAAALLTPGVAWVPRPFVAIVAQVGAMISFVRPEFAIRGVGRIHAPAPAGVRATLGVEFRIRLPTDRR